MAHKLFYLFLSILVFFSCVGGGGGGGGSSSVSAESTNSYWALSRFPISFVYSTDFNSSEIAAVSTMVDAWEDALGDTYDFMSVSGGTSEKSASGLSALYDGEMGVYRATSWPSELPASALAVTQIYGTQSGANVVMDHADIIMNYENFTFTTDGSFGYDFQTVLLHEMGHFLGLSHMGSSTDDSVMYPSITRYVSNRAPLATDTATLTAKYAAVSSSLVAEDTYALKLALNGDEEDGEVIIRHYLMSNGDEMLKVFSKDGNEISSRNLHCNSHRSLYTASGHRH